MDDVGSRDKDTKHFASDSNMERSDEEDDYEMEIVQCSFDEGDQTVQRSTNIFEKFASPATSTNVECFSNCFERFASPEEEIRRPKSSPAVVVPDEKPNLPESSCFRKEKEIELCNGKNIKEKSTEENYKPSSTRIQKEFVPQNEKNPTENDLNSMKKIKLQLEDCMNGPKLIPRRLERDEIVSINENITTEILPQAERAISPVFLFEAAEFLQELISAPKVKSSRLETFENVKIPSLETHENIKSPTPEDVNSLLPEIIKTKMRVTKRSELKKCSSSKSSSNSEKIEDTVEDDDIQFIYASRSFVQTDKHFPCSYCGECFSLPAELNDHVRCMHLENPDDILFSCEFCSQQFQRKCDLARHRSFHTKQHKCKYCVYGSDCPTDLSRHISSHHPTESFDEVVDVRKVKKFVDDPPYVDTSEPSVSIDDETSETEENIKMNLRLRDRSKISYKEISPTQSDEDEESDDSVKEKPIEESDSSVDDCIISTNFRRKQPPKNLQTCDICGNSYQLNHIARHRLVHFTSKPSSYKCKHCGYPSDILNNLKRHVLTVHKKEFFDKDDFIIQKEKKFVKYPKECLDKGDFINQNERKFVINPPTFEDDNLIDQNRRKIVENSPPVENLESKEECFAKDGFIYRNGKRLVKDPPMFGEVNSIVRKGEKFVENPPPFDNLELTHVETRHLVDKVDAVNAKIDKEFAQTPKLSYAESSPSILENDMVSSNAKDSTDQNDDGASDGKSNDLFTCSLCNKWFLSEADLNHHIGIEHSSVKFTCEICQKTFKTHNQLARHRLLHGPKRYLCKYCGASSLSSTYLKSHITSIHKKKQICDGDVIVRKENCDEYLFECEICGEKFQSGIQVRAHGAVHSSIPKPYVCEYCGRSYCKMVDWRSHVNYHLKKKRIKNGPGFVETSSLDESVSTVNGTEDKESPLKHSNSSPPTVSPKDCGILKSRFSCSICRKSFRYQSLLALHYARHASAKQFECKHCLMLFRMMGNLKRHIVKNHKLNEQNEIGEGEIIIRKTDHVDILKHSENKKLKFRSKNRTEKSPEEKKNEKMKLQLENFLFSPKHSHRLPTENKKRIKRKLLPDDVSKMALNSIERLPNSPEEQRKCLRNKKVQMEDCYLMNHLYRRCQECSNTEKGKEGDLSDQFSCRFKKFRLTMNRRFNQVFLEADANDVSVWSESRSSNKFILSQIEACYIVKNSASQFKKILDSERDFINKYRDWQIMSPTGWVSWKQATNCREICDQCSRTIFNFHLFCPLCGHTVCQRCANDCRSTTEKQFLCRNHTGGRKLCLAQIIPDSQSLLRTLETLNSQLQMVLQQHKERESNGGGVEESLSDDCKCGIVSITGDDPSNFSGEYYFNGDLMILNDVTNENALNAFQDHWRKYRPVIVRNIDTNVNFDMWTPDNLRTLSSKYSLNGSVQDCLKGDVFVDFDVDKFWKGFIDVDERAENSLLKLKDWPTDKDFAVELPSHYENFCRALPFPKYSHPDDGVYSLTTHLPKSYLKPDLGPKLYCAYEMFDHPLKGSTNLHIDGSDACNLLMNVTIPKNRNDEAQFVYKIISHLDGQGLDPKDTEQILKNKERIGALWTIFKPEDTDTIRIFLEKIKPAGSQSDVIHDQMRYVHAGLRAQLRDEYGVEGFTFVQMLGDAVFIPAGAAHQVQNLVCCIKMAEDFVSPEGINKCAMIDEEFRQLSVEHTNHEDKLQLPNVVLHSIKEAVRVMMSDVGHVSTTTINDTSTASDSMMMNETTTTSDVSTAMNDVGDISTAMDDATTMGSVCGDSIEMIDVSADSTANVVKL